MNKDGFLKYIDKNIDKVCAYEKLEEAIQGHEIGADPVVFLHGKADNPLDTGVYVHPCDLNPESGELEFSEYNSCFMTRNIKDEIFIWINDEPDLYREKALIMAGAFEDLAKDIRGKYSKDTKLKT